jgi:hypothetical protein
MSVFSQSARATGRQRGESRQDAEAHSRLAARAFRRTPNLLGALAQRTGLVAAFDFVAGVVGVGGSGKAAIPVPAESQSVDRVKHHAADGSV